MTRSDDVLFEGTMFKKGRRKEWFSIIKPWVERTIKLIRNGYIQYFDKDKLRDQINIKGAHVVERSPEEAEGRFFAFEIISADEKEASLLLSAKTRIEMNSWIKCILLVATDSWEKAKEAESMSSARSMPFPVRIRTNDLTDRTSIFSHTNPSIGGRVSSNGFTQEETLSLIRRCESHSNLWKGHLSCLERAVLISLRQQIDLNEQILAEAAGKAGNDNSKHKTLRHKESEANVWVNRLGQKAASKELTIAPYLGFQYSSSPGEDEKEKDEYASGAGSDNAPGEQQAPLSLERSPKREGTEVNPSLPGNIRRGSLAGVKANLAMNKVAMNDSIKKRDEESVPCEPWVVLCSADNLAAANTPVNWIPQARPRIFRAIEEGNEAYIAQLCAGGNADIAELNARLKEREYGVNVLNAVMSYGRTEILRLLISQPEAARPHLRSMVNDTLALQQSDDNSVVGWMVGETILHAACTRFVNQDSDDGKRRTLGQIECLRIAMNHMTAEQVAETSNSTGSRIALCDINIQTKHSRWTPLHKAAWFGLAGHVKMLLSYKKPESQAHEVERSTAEEEEEEEREEEDSKFLHIDKRDSSGFTALHLAAAAGHLECVQALLDGGANPTLPGGFELDALTKASSTFTIMHLAAYGGHSRVLDYLFSLDPAKLTFKPRSVQTKAALQAFFCRRRCMGGCEGGVDYFAVLSGSVDAVQVCLSHGMLSYAGTNGAPEALCASDGTSPLHIAAFLGNAVVVSFLLKNNANVDKISNAHRTPLHEACRGGSVAVIEELIAAGANCSDSERDFWGNTALHLAAGANRLSAVKCLVERYTVNIFPRNTEGLSALDVAVAREHNEVALYLQKHMKSGNDDGDVIPMKDHARRSSYHVIHPQSMSNNIDDVQHIAAAAVAASSALSAPSDTKSPQSTSTKTSRFGGASAAAAAAAAATPPVAPAPTAARQSVVLDLDSIYPDATSSDSPLGPPADNKQAKEGAGTDSEAESPTRQEKGASATQATPVVVPASVSVTASLFAAVHSDPEEATGPADRS